MVTLITLIVAFVVLVGNLIAAKLIFDKTKHTAVGIDIGSTTVKIAVIKEY